MVASLAPPSLLWPALPRGGANEGAEEAADELARAFRAGEPSAFGRLVTLHERSVYALCLRLLGHPEEARDAAQEAFVRAYERLELAERSARLAAAIGRLPESQREALLLFHQEQLSYREIAAVLDAPLGTVMTWLHRARATLRVELGEGA